MMHLRNYWPLITGIACAMLILVGLLLCLKPQRSTAELYSEIREGMSEQKVTAILGGPDGVRMATRGDTVPGIGRIDSIVRWGNRWIVATAGGLISTP